MKWGVVVSLGLRPLVRAFHHEQGSRGNQLVGTVFGIALSLVPLVLVIQLSSGMIEGITSRYLETYTYHLQVQSYDSGDPALLEEKAELLRRVPGVTRVVMERQGFGLAYAAAGGREGVTIRALPSDMWENDEGMRRFIRFSRGAWDLSSPENALLGEQLAAGLGVGPGDSIKILTARTMPNGAYIPRVSTLKVVGVFSSGYQDLDKMWVIVGHEKGVQLLFENASETFLGIKVEDPYGPLQPVINNIHRLMPPGWGVYTWQNLNSSRNQNFQTTKALLLFIMGLILCVAVVNISSSLVMMVLENQHEIAIMKSLGASPGGITAIYVLSGLAAGLIGIVLGVAVGLFLAVNINEIIFGVETFLTALSRFYSFINPFREFSGAVDIVDARYYLESIPVRIRWNEIALTAAGTAFLSLAVSWWPARRAAAVRPLSVMRRV